MQLLTAKLPSKDLAALKKSLLRPGFVQEWDSLDALAAGFQKVLLSKENATASAGYKLFTTYDPEAVLWLGFTSKNAAVQERFRLFLKVWPDARQGIPHALMQEMRITPELATYGQIVHAVFLELIDGRLTTPEEMRAFLEPHSPPAPPPQVTIKRPRVKRGAEKVKERSFDDDDEAEESLVADDDLDDIGGDEDEIDLGLPIPKGHLEVDGLDDRESAEDDLEGDEDEEPVHSPKSSGKKSAPHAAAMKGAKPTSAPAKAGKSAANPIAETLAKAEKPLPPAPKSVPAAKPAAKPRAPVAKAKPAAPSVKAKPTPAPNKAAPAAAPKAGKAVKPPARPPAKPVAKAPAKPAAKAPAKPAAKAPSKSAAKTPAKAPAKAPVKAKVHQAAKPSKPAQKKPAPKPAKKR
jgi:hypothetical protein